VTGLAVLGGIGFTVSLLIAGIAFRGEAPQDEHVKVAVLVGSLTAAVLAGFALRLRNRTYRRLHDAEHMAPAPDPGGELTGAPDRGTGRSVA